LTETENYPIGKINYERFKKSSSDKIVYHEGKYQVKRKTKISGYDNLMRRWNKVKVTEEYLPLSVLNPAPQKEVESVILLVRSATDYRTLRELKGYFKKTMKVSVLDKDSNIYLTVANKKIFMTDLHKVTAPLQLNSVARNVKLEFVGEEERVSEEQKDKLVSEGTPLYEELIVDGKPRYMQIVKE
jgi:hypothetical protein